MGRVLLRLGGGFVLGFDDHGGAARRGYEHVGVTAGMGGEGLGVLGEDPAAGHHAAEEVAEALLALGSLWLGMARSGGGVVDAGSIADSSRDVRGDAEGKP